MTETEVTISSNNNHLTSGGDTEIDLYADVVETELANVCISFMLIHIYITCLTQH